MSQSLIANQAVATVQNAVTGQPVILQSQTLTSTTTAFNNLSVQNTPLIGTTLVGYPNPTFFQSVFPPTLTTFIILLVDKNNNYIQLPITTNTFFTGASLYWNKFGPGTGGAFTFIAPLFGTGTLPNTSPLLHNYINGADSVMYHNFIVPVSTNPQVIEYYPTSSCVTGAAFVPQATLTPGQNFVKQLCIAPDTTLNYLKIGFSGISSSWTPGTGLPVGTFAFYITYMTLY